MNIVGNKNLPAQRMAACAAIDAAAEMARQQYVTPGSVQAMVYLEKLAEARAFLAAFPNSATAPDTPDAASWPYVSAERGITAPSMWGVATRMVSVAQAWTTVAPQIEATRLAAKAAVMAAATAPAIASAQASATFAAPASTGTQSV